MPLPKRTARAPAAKARKKPKAPERRDITYYVQVLDWEWRFWFGVFPRTKPDRSPIGDNRTIRITGWLLAPTVAKVESVELSIQPAHFFNPAHIEEHKLRPEHIGSMELTKGTLDCRIYVPAEVASSILISLSSGRFRFASLHSEKLHYRAAAITGFGIRAELDPELVQELGITLP